MIYSDVEKENMVTHEHEIQILREHHAQRIQEPFHDFLEDKTRTQRTLELMGITVADFSPTHPMSAQNFLRTAELGQFCILNKYYPYLHKTDFAIAVVVRDSEGNLELMGLNFDRDTVGGTFFSEEIHEDDSKWSVIGVTRNKAIPCTEADAERYFWFSQSEGAKQDDFDELNKGVVGEVFTEFGVMVGIETAVLESSDMSMEELLVPENEGKIVILNSGYGTTSLNKKSRSRTSLSYGVIHNSQLIELSIREFDPERERQIGYIPQVIHSGKEKKLIREIVVIGVLEKRVNFDELSEELKERIFYKNIETYLDEHKNDSNLLQLFSRRAGGYVDGRKLIALNKKLAEAPWSEEGEQEKAPILQEDDEANEMLVKMFFAEFLVFILRKDNRIITHTESYPLLMESFIATSYLLIKPREMPRKDDQYMAFPLRPAEEQIEHEDNKGITDGSFQGNIIFTDGDRK